MEASSKAVPFHVFMVPFKGAPNGLWGQCSFSREYLMDCGVNGLRLFESCWMIIGAFQGLWNQSALCEEQL